MPILHAIVLGIVQGLAEFLPISSSGHLLLVPWAFGWHDFVGNADLEKTFDVALHLGTLIGALAYFRHDVVRYARAGFSRRREPSIDRDRRFAWLIALSCVPGAITGAVFESPIEDNLGQIWLIAFMLIAFAVVLYWADHRRGDREADDLGLRDALFMGVGQALALQPGVSRSGVTITVGRVVGFDRDAAARLSFLMGLPITAGAVAFKLGKQFTDGFPPGFVGPFVWGTVAAGVSGYLAVWGLLKIVRTRSFTPFIVYRILLGAVVLAVYTAGIR